MNIDRAIRLLRAMQNPTVGVVEVCCAESCHGKVENVYPSPEDYALDEAINGLEQLKEYRQLEEQDRLIKLPCKIGTKVYDITWWDDVQEKVVVEGKTYYRTSRKHKIIESTFDYFDIKELGKTLFLTKAEAEAKLKELRGENK